MITIGLTLEMRGVDVIVGAAGRDSETKLALGTKPVGDVVIDIDVQASKYRNDDANHL